VIEPNGNELPGQTNAANGRTRSTLASLGKLARVALGSKGHGRYRAAAAGQERKQPEPVRQVGRLSADDPIVDHRRGNPYRPEPTGVAGRTVPCTTLPAHRATDLDPLCDDPTVKTLLDPP